MNSAHTPLTSPLSWPRARRAHFTLPEQSGVYALFLARGAELPGITAGDDGLLYIGLANGRRGLKGRCHFDGRTGNHSPRKTLAVLLMDELGLTPILITKPSSSPTWGLEPRSEARLTQWMHDNLELAFELCDDPDARETEMIGRYVPPLNLAKCPQAPQHWMISRARDSVLGKLGSSASARSPGPRSRQPVMKITQPDVPAGNVDTADGIAGRYGLNPKSYRQRLRTSISWYRKPQDWTFEVNSSQWRDLIRVAEAMSR